MPEILNHTELHKFAKELAQGSTKALHFAEWAARDIFVKAHGRPASVAELLELEQLLSPPASDDRWNITPNGVWVTANEQGDKKSLTLSEFIGGIAVACDIEPTQAEVEATIFNLGKYMGELDGNG